MKHITLCRLIVVGIAIQLFASSLAHAQTGAGGLFRPWPKGQMYDINGNVMIQDEAQTDFPGINATLTLAETYGRFRLSDKYELNPTIGFNVRYIDIDSTNNALPGQLTDQSIGFGTPIGQFGDGWFVAANAAVGYAGTDPYAVSDSWYAKGTVIVGTKLSESETLVFGLDYDGNRSFMPDVPLPGIAYSKRIDKTLLLAVGFPYETIEWEPLEGLKVDVYVELPDVFKARVSYNFAKPIGIYASYEDRIEPFHTDGLYPVDRLFYVHHRVEGGVRFDPAEQISIFGSIGYAFGQEFDTGFDSRELTNITDLSDEIYGRVSIEARF